MTVYVDRDEQRRFWPRYEEVRPRGLPILRVSLPRRYSHRRLEQLARRLYRQGARRFFSGDPALDLSPLVPVSPLSLYRAKGAELVLALLPGVPVRARRVALRGEEAGSDAWALAERLCPQVGTLFLDFDRGEEALAGRLRERFGAAALHLGQGLPPQAAVELSPRSLELPQTLRLWGEPELQGLCLTAEAALPGFPELPLWELWWETGRLEAGEVRVCPREELLDRRGENTYNNRIAS